MMAAILLAFYMVTGGRDGAEPSGWFRVGSASSALIVAGQWWRAVTALTLHADVMHLAGNAIACLIFVAAVGRWIGSGLAACSILLGGAGGNLLTAWVHREAHVSVGASTATFAALGLLAGLQVVRRVRIGPLKRRAWIPIGAGLALFAMLGVGERSDVLAHLLGLGVGSVLGMLVALPFRRPWPGLVQGTLSVVALGAVAGCWLLAWR
jgi:membrane associated rhomboid family serine protease